MKTLNIKIPISVAQRMDNNAQLNPQYITSFIVVNMLNVENVLDSPIKELTYNYAFKIPSDLHTTLKLKGIEHDISMNELVGRLIESYYKG